MKHKINLTDLRVVALLAFFCCALWGSAFSSVKTGYRLLGIPADDWASQLLFAGIRFSCAGLLAISFGSLRAKKLLIPAKRTLPKIAAISAFQTILQYFCYYIGLAHTSGVKAAVLIGTNVFTAIMISSLIFRLEKLTLRKIAGSLVGFSGIIFINLNGLSGGFSFSLIGEGLIMLSTVSSGFSSSCMKKLSKGENPVLLSGWQFFFGGIVLGTVGLIGGGKLPAWTPGSALLLLYLAFVSAAAYSVWATLLKANPVSRVAVFGFLNPVCGVVISALVLREFGQINAAFLLALILVCTGIIIVNYNRTKKEE